MGTNLTLNYSIISGSFGNISIRTKINGKPEKLPFESMYFKETPKEVLKNLVGDYNVKNYLDLETNSLSRFEFKKHTLFYGLSIKEANLEGVIINNEIKNINLSFISKSKKNKEDNKGSVKGLIRKYLVTTHTEYGPIYLAKGKGPQSDNHYKIENYFEKRKKSKNPEQEKQLSQILEYAQVILDKPNFSINNLEEMVSEKVVVI